MNEILKMMFMDIMHKEENIKGINTIDDLCCTVWDKNRIANIFAAINDDGNIGYKSKEILEIANMAYQEVCKNV